jgi:hypothetical protein
MGQQVNGRLNTNSALQAAQTQQLGDEDKIVLHKVEVVRQREVIKVPEIVVEEKPTTRYIEETRPTIRYDVTTEPTTRYDATAEETIKYIPREEETIKYVPKEVVVEKPVCVDKPYERPVITEKEYQIASYSDVNALRELLDLIPLLRKELDSLRKYKLVEEVVKVPKIQYEPTKVERVVWVDKQRCKSCGGLSHANND